MAQPNAGGEIPPAKAQRAALIFVPGISRTWGDQSLGELTGEIMTALDRATKGVSYSATAARSLDVPEVPGPVRFTTVSRASGGADQGEATAVLDVYELTYITTLATPYEKRSLLTRALLVAWAIVLLFPLLIAMIKRPAKTGKEKAQIIYGLGLLGLYSLFLVVLAATLVQTTADAIESSGIFADSATVESQSPSASPSPSPSIEPGRGQGDAASEEGFLAGIVAGIGGFFDSAAGLTLRVIALASALLWLLLPPKHKVKEAITTSGTDFLAVDYYIRSGEGAARLSGELRNLIDWIGEEEENGAVKYRRVDLAGYSMGSILAFNAVFPAGAVDPEGPIREVETLVTIGSPFDAVRLVKPRYFKGRSWLPDHPARWLNVYIAGDVLGSNFRDDGANGPADATAIATALDAQGNRAADVPRPKNLQYVPGGVPAGGLLDALFLRGFKLHGDYWRLDVPGDTTCWDDIVRPLYRDDPVLIGPPTS